VLSVQAAPPTVQWPLPGVCVHCADAVHGWPGGFTQVPLVFEHCADVVQAKPAGLVHVPGDAVHWPFAVHCVAGGFRQVPAGTHGLVVPLHAAAVRLQVPLRIAQLAAVAHGSPSVLQFPIEGQFGAEQLAPVMLHWPGWGRHWALLVQVVPVIVHVPGLGVQTGG
jgi:hypothetical protein